MNKKITFLLLVLVSAGMSIVALWVAEPFLFLGAIICVFASAFLLNEESKGGAI